MIIVTIWQKRWRYKSTTTATTKPPSPNKKVPEAKSAGKESIDKPGKEKSLKNFKATTNSVFNRVELDPKGKSETRFCKLNNK